MIRWTLKDKEWFLAKANEIEFEGYERVACSLRRWIEEQTNASLE